MEKEGAFFFTVLIVEDHPLSLAIATRLIEQLGHRVVVPEMISDQRLDVKDISIILVGFDPDNKGIDLQLHPILQLYPDLPLIGMTTSGASIPDNRLDAVIQKPLKRRELEVLISTYMTSEKPYSPLDLSYLQQVSNGDNNRIAELLEIYIQEAPVTLAKMKHHLNQGQFGYLRDLAHKLHSNYQYLGAKEMAQMAAQIEQLANKRDRVETLPELVKTLQNRSMMFSESLKRLKNRLI